MENDKLDWFPIYWQRFIIGTLDMSSDQVGAYVLLLIYEWDKGFIPDEMKEIKKISRCSDKKLEKVLEKFEKIEGKLYNRTLEIIREQQQIKARKGVVGATVKWGTQTNKQNRSERLTEARKKGTHTKMEWAEMLTFFKSCVKCGDNDSIVKDHIIPIYQGGSDSIKNLQPLCTKCNSGKGPDNTDYRPAFCKKNACEMPAKWLALREEEKREEKNRLEEKREDAPAPELNFNYMINGKEILSVEETFKENFPVLLTDLKIKHGELKIKNWLKEFSELHKQKSWKDIQDFRQHISSFIKIQSEKKNAGTKKPITANGDGPGNF
jgi:uncharacterized protein YdaU (DUF1376 family)